MKRVLVTGATGFIGRHCLPGLLASGYEVHVVSSRAGDNQALNMHAHQADLLDPPQVAALISRIQPSHLLHLAWYTQPGQYWAALENMRWVQASIDLLMAFRSNGGQRAVMAGSCAEYDWTYGYCTEHTTPLRPATLYGSAKSALQALLDVFARQTGISAAWGRIFFLYGPHEHPDRLVASVIRALLQRQAAHCSHGNQIRDFLYVQDAADAFVALLESDVQGAVNIASGQPVTLKQIIYTIGEQLQQRDQVRLGALPAPAGEQQLLVANTSRLNNEVGWRSAYDLDSGIAQTIRWWKGVMSDD